MCLLLNEKYQISRNNSQNDLQNGKALLHARSGVLPLVLLEKEKLQTVPFVHSLFVP